MNRKRKVMNIHSMMKTRKNRSMLVTVTLKLKALNHDQGWSKPNCGRDRESVAVNVSVTITVTVAWAGPLGRPIVMAM
jgi:hypothetical protein